MTCLFCKIVAKEIPATTLYDDDHVVAFRDLRPQAPTHVLVIPRVHIASLAEASAAQAELLGRLQLAAARIARDLGLEATGYRTVFNTGADAGQTVLHLHLHLLGGRPMAWPPG